MAAAGPIVSIITPTFNRARFIGQAVESVLAQTIGDYELLIIDDGSTDNTAEVVAPFLGDHRIQYQVQRNLGQSVARNKGLKAARGEFICFLDSDDAWVPDKLEYQLAVMDHNPEVDIVHGDEIIIDEQGHELSRENIRRYSGIISRQLLADNSVSINTAMVRRHCFDALGGFNTGYGVADDYELWLRFSTRYKFLYVPSYFGYYRVMSDQISSDKDRRFRANEQIIQEFLAANPGALSPRERHWGLSRFYCRKARYYAATNCKGTALNSVLKALRYKPLDIVVWRGVYRVLFPKRGGKPLNNGMNKG